MSKQVIQNYSFNSAAKTITLSDFSSGQPVHLERLALITDTTTNQILYNFADSTISTATVSSNNVITLSTLPGGVAGSDTLRIDYNSLAGDPTYDSTTLATGAATAANQTNGTQQTKLTDGTNTANILKGDGTAAGQNSQLVGGSYLEKSGLSTASTTNNDLLPSLDVSNYKFVSLQIAGSWTGTLNVQISNDNANFNTQMVLNTASAAIQAGITVSGVYTFPANARYLRVRVTTGGTGTIAGTVELWTIPPPSIFSNVVSATQSGTWTVGSSSAISSAAPGTAFYMGLNGTGSVLTGLNSATNMGDANSGATWAATGVGLYNGTNYDRLRTATSAAATTGTGLLGAGVLGIYNSSPPTITSGNYERLQLDSSGNLKVNIASGSGGSTQITDGTNTANVLKSDGTAAGQNAQMVSGTGYTTATLTLNSSSPNTTWYDMLNYAWVSVEVLTNTTPATLTWQTSGDAAQTNATGMSLIQSNNTSGGLSATTTSAIGTFHGPRTGRYFRVTSNNGAGTTTLVITFHTSPSAMQTMPALVSSSTATGSAVPANAFYIAGAGASSGNLTGAVINLPGSDANGSAAGLLTTTQGLLYNGTTWDRQRSATSAAATTGTGIPAAGVLGIYNSSAPTVTSGNYERLQLDSSGNLKVYVATKLDASNDAVTVGGGLMPLNTALNTYEVQLTTNGTTTVQSSTCYVSSIVISIAVAGTASTVTVEDGQATPLSLFNAGATTTVSIVPTVVNFQTPIKFTSGIKLVTAGSAAATVNVWINYYV